MLIHRSVVDAAAVALLVALAPAQNLVVDGDLENHSSGGCSYNNSNSAFNAAYVNAHSFGQSGGIDIMQGSCFGNPAPSGATRVALAWNNVGTGDKDAMALDLTAPLTVGQVYCLTFQAEDLPFGAGGETFEIGVSAANNAFGSQVFAATATSGWGLFSTVFQAPFAATFLTVRCPSGPDMWVAFDDFDLRAGSTPATTTTIGVGCNGPALVATNRPVLGATWNLDLTGIPSGAVLGFMLLDFTNPNQALTGAPGCTSYSGGLATLLLGLPVLTPTVTLPLPLSKSFVGLPLYAQGGAFVPGVNPLGLAASNGIMGSVGDV